MLFPTFNHKHSETQKSIQCSLHAWAISSTGDRYGYCKITPFNITDLLGCSATKDSWECAYCGQVVEALQLHIENHFEPSSNKIHAHYLSIVQSSGMGKSRAVDELGKNQFCILMNLRVAQSTGNFFLDRCWFCRWPIMHACASFLGTLLLTTLFETFWPRMEHRPNCITEPAVLLMLYFSILPKY